MRTPILLFILFLYSCSHSSIQTQIANEGEDLLTEESFMRYNSTRHLSVQKESDKIFLVAQSHCHQNDIAIGLELLKKELTKNESNPLYWSAVGNCYYLNENLPKAKFYYDIGFEKVKKDNSALALLNNNIALVALKQRRYSRAQNLFKKALELAPNSYAVQYNYAQLKIQFSHLDEAERILTMLQRKAPRDLDILASLGTINVLSGRTKEAIDLFERIPLQARKRGDIGLHYSLALFEDGRPEEAREFLLKLGIMGQRHLRRLELSLNNEIDSEMKRREIAQE